MSRDGKLTGVVCFESDGYPSVLGHPDCGHFQRVDVVIRQRVGFVVEVPVARPHDVEAVPMDVHRMVLRGVQHLGPLECYLHFLIVLQHHHLRRLYRYRRVEWQI